jgi:hypothetical protein
VKQATLARSDRQPRESSLEGWRREGGQLIAAGDLTAVTSFRRSTRDRRLVEGLPVCVCDARMHLGHDKVTTAKRSVQHRRVRNSHIRIARIASLGSRHGIPSRRPILSLRHSSCGLRMQLGHRPDGAAAEAEEATSADGRGGRRSARRAR